MKKLSFLLSLLLFSIGIGATQLNAQLLDRSGWTITASSEGTETATSGFATTIIDGDVSTYWHSYWNGMSNAKGYLTPMLPQFFTIDLGSTQTFKTIGYIPRPNCANGTAYTWKLYVSDTEFATTDSETSPETVVNDLGDAQMEGTWSYDGFDPNSQIQTATSNTELSGRYVMFVITSAVGNSYGSCAEFFLSNSETMDYPFETVTYGPSFEENQTISLSSTPATSIEAGKWYAIKNVNQGYWQDQQSGAWKTVKSASIDGKDANAYAAYLFKFEDADNGKYNIISGNGISIKLLLSGWGSSSSQSTKPFETFTIAHIGENETEWYIQQSSNSAIADGNGSVVGWGTEAPTNTGGNNDHQFFEVTFVDGGEPADYHITPANNKVYTIATPTRGNWAYVPEYTSGEFSGENALVSTQVSGLSVTVDDANKKFAILTSDNSNYYIYNIAANKFVSADGSVAPLSIAPTTSGTQLIDNASNNADYPYVVAIDGRQIAISNYYTDRGGIISSWNDLTDEGNQVRITEVSGETFDYTLALARVKAFEAIAAANANIGTTYGTYASSDDYASALASAQAALVAENATTETLSAATSALTTAKAALSLNVPADGAFIRIKSHNNSSAYLAADNSESKESRANFSAATDGTTIFCYKDGYLVNYNTGLYICNNNNFAGYNGTQTAGSAVSFVKNANVSTEGAGAYYVNFTGNSNATRHLFAHDANYTDAGGGAPDNVRYTFDLEAVESIPVTISAAGYATLYAPQALTIPEGVTAYAVSMGENSANLTAIEGGVIPANTGVVLQGEAGDYNFAVTTTDATVSSDLSGIVPTTTFSTDVNPYILANKESGVGFYEMTSSSDRDVHGFRAYFNAPTAGANPFIFNFGDATGIDSINAISADKNAPIYDLSGRRVQKAVKGVYIQGGKKIYVK